MPDNQEIELAFTLLDDRSRLKTQKYFRSESKVQQLVSIYYDSPDQALAAARWSVRVRCTNGEFEQTVKGPTVSGRRPEWNISLENNELDRSALRATPVGNLIEGKELEPLFICTVHREIWMYSENNVTI